MSSWLPSFASLPGFVRRSRSEAEGLVLRPMVQHQVSLDLDSLPEQEGESEVLLLQDIHRISSCLPPRIIGSNWRLVFTTSRDGFSLASLFRKSQGLSGPTLLAIEDTNGAAFGALVSDPLRLEEHFYGTGESFLYSVRPRYGVYNWSGENLLFIQGSQDSLVIGAGEGHFGLYIDGSLYQGRSQSCLTYKNQPLSPTGDFVIKCLECWVFS